VGVSGFCDWPPEARTKPCAVTSLIDVDSMSSDEIEAAMQVSRCAGAPVTSSLAAYYTRCRWWTAHSRVISHMVSLCWDDLLTVTCLA
jgi:hypothetical protein